MQINRTVLAAATAALLVVSIGRAVGAETASAPQASWYFQPDKLFGIAVPPEAKAQDAAPNTTVISSQNGYVLRIQTAPMSTSSLPDMAAKLEAVYLGAAGKTWSSKLSQDEVTVGGLPALATVYEGSKLRSKAIIARGAKTDFVMIFSAPSEAYSARIADFEWMLANFRPAAEEVAKVGPTKESPKKAAAPLPVMPGEIAHLSGPDLGYSVAYPDDWTADRVSPAAVLLGGPAGTEAYYATVAIQNVQPPSASKPQDAMESVLASLKSELGSHAQDVRYTDEGPMAYQEKGAILKAFQFVVSYQDGGRRYKQWTVVVSRPDNTVVHIWSYRAPETRFDIYRPIAEAIRQSWKIDVAAAG